eukprot:gene6359-2987_t
MRHGPASDARVPVGRPTRFTTPRGLIRAQAYQYATREHVAQTSRKVEKLPLENISVEYDKKLLLMSMEVKGYKTIDQDVLYTHNHMLLMQNIWSLEKHAELARQLPDPRSFGTITVSHAFGSKLLNRLAKDLLAELEEEVAKIFRESEDVLGKLRLKGGHPKRVRQQTGKAGGTIFHPDTKEYDYRLVYRVPGRLNDIRHAPDGKQSSSLLLRKAGDEAGNEKHMNIMALQIPQLAV